MSDFNLLPWREQLRAAAMRRWRWGLLLALLASSCLVVALHLALTAWHQPVEQEKQAWLQTQAELHRALADQALWLTRQQQARQVQRQWQQWRAQQTQAWQLMGQVLALSPQGIQIERMVWRDQQVQLSGWAISAAHVQAWQDALQAQRTDALVPQWRNADGLACLQQRFVLRWRSTAVGS
jgi:Tfp pilus assembly protein PilN